MARPLRITKELVAKMIEMYTFGISYAEIGRKLGVHHTTAMHYIKTAIKMGYINEVKFDPKQKPSKELIESLYNGK